MNIILTRGLLHPRPTGLYRGAAFGDPTFPFEGTDVLAATEAWWNGTPAAKALTRDGRLWFLEAPENTLLPYATYFLVSDAIDTWTTAFALKRASVQINLHANTASSARLLGLALRKALKGAPLSVAGQTVLYVLPDGDGIQIGSGLGPGGRDCYIATETFEIPYTE